jgi:NADPH:quinone reductase-like Zn-dependent oxidoreductase
MKAMVLKNNGSIENFLLTDVELPRIQPDEVLIKTQAIAVNPVDTYVRQYEFALKTFMQPKNETGNYILGWDVSFKVGDAVFGMINFPGKGKAYAEYVAAPASHITLKPGNTSHEQAAAATLAALTAWQSLVSYAKIKKGEKVLIHAAAGGVGHYAVQFAKHVGAYVVATASAVNKDFVLGLGADEFIDYTAEKLERRITDADVVIDPMPDDHVLRSLEVIKKGGRLITLLNLLDDEKVQAIIKTKQVFAHKLTVQSNGGDMYEIAQLLKDGAVRSHISHTYSFAEIPKAHEQVATGKTRGKVVITL